MLYCSNFIHFLNIVRLGLPFSSKRNLVINPLGINRGVLDIIQLQNETMSISLIYTLFIPLRIQFEFFFLVSPAADRLVSPAADSLEGVGVVIVEVKIGSVPPGQ